MKRLTIDFGGEGERFTLYLDDAGNIRTCAEAPLQAGPKRDLLARVNIMELTARSLNSIDEVHRMPPVVEVPFSVEVDDVRDETHGDMRIRDWVCMTCPPGVGVQQPAARRQAAADKKPSRRSRGRAA